MHELPLAGRTAKGKHIVNLLPLRQDEKICAVIATRNFDENEGKYLVLGTRNGIVKKTLFASYNTPLKADGIIAINDPRGRRAAWRCATPPATTTS